jgi:hypothetical protein
MIFCWWCSGVPLVLWFQGYSEMKTKPIPLRDIMLCASFTWTTGELNKFEEFIVCMKILFNVTGFLSSL